MSRTTCGLWSAGAAFVFVAMLPFGVNAATTHAANYYPAYAPDAARITGAIDTSKRVTLGNAPALAVSKNDIGAVPTGKTIRNVTLLLKRSDAKQKQFDAYVHALSNPSSPYFHHWLTAAQVGTMFGPAQSDISQVKQWLQGQGLKVTAVSPSGMMVHFSGSATAVGNAFHTSLHNYTIHGETHFANNGPQQIPAALAPVVAGAPSLGNFFPKPQHVDVGKVAKNKATGMWTVVSKAKGASPRLTVNGDQSTAYVVAPADFNTIYNVNPLWNQGTPIRGAGQTVAVLERTDVLPADVQTFRSSFLPGNAQGVVSYIHPLTGAGDTSCTDPSTNGDESEAALDAEWIGAAAPDANVVFASCDDSQSATFGPFMAAENLLSGYSSTIPSVFSLSYGECEAYGVVDGTDQMAAELWEQAASQGVTVFVSTGDTGSTGCDGQGETATQFGTAVNGMASTPYDVAVGGTDFDDINNPNQYWSSGNGALYESALSYIPEMTWNDSCASSYLDNLLGQIYSGNFANGVQACNDPNGSLYLNDGGASGGPSYLWSQPMWQAGLFGVKNYGVRTLPDVSLFAANGFYGNSLVYCMSDASQNGSECDYGNPDNVFYNSAGGTSFAAPAMAGVQALINQATGQSNGNVLPAFYSIANKEYGTNATPNTANLSACNSGNGAGLGSNCVFNNVTNGNIAMPCYAGTSDCYTGAGLTPYGVVSAGGYDSLDPAWNATPGYSMATGLGSINATNLVNALTNFYKPFQHNPGYSAPYDFLSGDGTNASDGFSDIAVVNPTAGTFTQLAMKGSVVIANASQSIAPGYTIGAAGQFFSSPVTGIPGSDVADLAWTGPDHRLYVWLSDANSQYTMTAIGQQPYPAQWALLGAGNFDDSGSDELFWWNSTTGQLGWWQLTSALVAANDGHPPQRTYSSNISRVTQASTGDVPHLADLDGDGYVDIVWTTTTDNNVYIWMNNKQGEFTGGASLEHPAGFTLFGAGDVTGNGQTSLFWVNAGTNQLQIWNMNGRNVTSIVTRNITPGYTLASIADFDGDGLADLLWVGPSGDLWEWLSNGSGGFVSQQVADQTGAPLILPAGSQVQANRLQGGMSTSGNPSGAGVAH